MPIICVIVFISKAWKLILTFHIITIPKIYALSLLSQELDFNYPFAI